LVRGSKLIFHSGLNNYTLRLKTYSFNQYQYNVTLKPNALVFPVFSVDAVVAGASKEYRLGWAENTGADMVNFLLNNENLFSLNEDGETIVTSEELANLESFGFTGEPAIEVQLHSDEALYWSVLLQHLSDILKSLGLNAELPIALIADIKQVNVEGSMVHQSGKRLFSDDFSCNQLYSIGFLFEEPEHINRENRSLRMLSESLKKFPTGGGLKSINWGLTDDEKLRFIEPETTFLSAKIDIYLLFDELKEF